MFHNAHFQQDSLYGLCSTWICISTLPLNSVTLHKLLNLSVPQFPHMVHKDNNSTDWIGL